MPSVFVRQHRIRKILMNCKLPFRSGSAVARHWAWFVNAPVRSLADLEAHGFGPRSSLVRVWLPQRQSRSMKMQIPAAAGLEEPACCQPPDGELRPYL